MVIRNPVGAHYGLKDWIIQRATAIIMALYSVYFLLMMVLLKPSTFENWRLFFSGGFAKFATFLFFISLFYHAWIGVRDIWMDYIKPDGLRLVLMIATAAALVGYSGWAMLILGRV